MTSLIVTIISILLVGILAGTTLYYASRTVDEASPKVVATRQLNELNQVKAAIDVYRVDNQAFPEDVQALLDSDYLKSRPDELIFFERDRLVLVAQHEAACLAYNKTFDVEVIPLCSDPIMADFSSAGLCCFSGVEQ